MLERVGPTDGRGWGTLTMEVRTHIISVLLWLIFTIFRPRPKPVEGGLQC